MKKSTGRIFGWIGIVLLALVALIIGVLFVQIMANDDKVPSLFGYKPFIVLSGSMESKISKGDLVIVKKVDANTLKEKDVIAFRDENNYVVTHRIIEVTESNGQKAFVTKGDNNNVKDGEIVKQENVEGLYKFKLKGLGNVLLIMQKPATLIITLILIFGGGMLSIIYNNGKMSAAEKKELEELRKNHQKD